jgi:hypothetical protein
LKIDWLINRKKYTNDSSFLLSTYFDLGLALGRRLIFFSINFVFNFDSMELLTQQKRPNHGKIVFRILTAFFGVSHTRIGHLSILLGRKAPSGEHLRGTETRHLICSRCDPHQRLMDRNLFHYLVERLKYRVVESFRFRWIWTSSQHINFTKGGKDQNLYI